MVSSDELQFVVSLSQALFSLGLLVVTAVYTYYSRQQSAATQKQIDVTEAQTEATALPYLKTTIERPGIAECNFVIQNTGNGAAHNVSASWWIGSEKETREWQIPLLPAGRKHKFFLTESDGEESLPTTRAIKEAFEGQGFELRFEATCEDIFEKSHKFEETLNLEDAIWGREEDVNELLERPSEETIAEGVESISNDFNDVGNIATLLRRELPSLLHAHHTEQYVKHLEQFGELSVDQLARLSPEDYHLVLMRIRQLSDEGLVEFDEESGVARLTNNKQDSGE